MSDVNPTAVSSTADTIAQTPSLDSLSKEDLSKWRLTGEFPPSTSADPSSLAASTPAAPAEQAASTDATPQPASEPGVSEKDAKPRKNADTRKEELNREIRDLVAKRDALQREVDEGTSRRPAAPATEKPAPAVTASALRPDLSKDALTEAEFFSQFEGATYGDYTRYVARYEAAWARADERREDQQRTRNQSFTERLKPALDADKDLLVGVPDKLLHATRLELLSAAEPASAMNVVAQELYESSNPGALIRHFKDHPDDLDALERLANHAAVVRAVAKIEAKLETPAVPVVPTKTQSSAPPPPTTLGRKPALAPDEVESALAAGDFSRYRDEANRRDLAASSAR